MLVAPDDSDLDAHKLVSVATTHHDPARQLPRTNATSAVTAHAAALAAMAMSTYPRLRPETIRALLVHEAQCKRIPRNRPSGGPPQPAALREGGRSGSPVPAPRRVNPK